MSHALLIFPFLGTAVYTNVSAYMKHKYVDSTAITKIRPISQTFYLFTLIHNAALCSFSFYTCSVLLNEVSKSGIVTESAFYMSQPTIKTAIFWFYLSKYYEYVDTFILYAKGVNPIFLQKYHHIGAVICWHLCYVYDVDGIILGTVLNSAVHTVMYFYYFASILKLPVRWIRPYITGGQIVQLLAGIIINVVVYYPPVDTWPRYSCILIFSVYVAGLLYLFGSFALENYIRVQKPAKTIE